MTETRLFFVTDSEEDNEELHETYETAFDYANEMSPAVRPRIRVCIVKNAYLDNDNVWNYEDNNDTFSTVKILKEFDKGWKDE